MKVLFVNSVLDYGSTGRIVRELANSLLEEGHQVKVAFGKYSPLDLSNTIDLRAKYQGYVHVLLSRYFGRHGLHSTMKTRKLIDEVKKFKPDVIHLHNLHGYYVNVPMLLNFLKKEKIRIILTLHDAWAMSGSSASFEYNGCKVWDDGCVECCSTKDYPPVIGYINQKKNLDWKKKCFSGFEDLTIVTPSIWLRDLVKKTYLKDYDCIVVNNGIDTSTFIPTKNVELENIYGGRKVLLGVASIWDYRKGLEDFIALSKIINEEYIIILVGLNADQISMLPSNIIGIERTSDVKELASYYSMSHAFLNPTYEDNYPTTNLEALSCGTRVIAYDTGGNKEVNGIEIVKQGDVTEMYRQIQKDRPSNTYNDFSKERFAKQMMSIYAGQ